MLKKDGSRFVVNCWEVIHKIPISRLGSIFVSLTIRSDHYVGSSTIKITIFLLCPKCMCVVSLYYQGIQIGK